MPTKAMQFELLSECYWVWTTSYNGKGVSGCIVYKAKDAGDKGVKVYSGTTPSSSYNVANDTHIFLPAVGYHWDTELDNVGSFGYYWSRSLHILYQNDANALCVGSDLFDWGNFSRSDGQSVRPVVPGAAK